jgi:hypothetical protein
MDREEMSNLHRGPSIDVSYQVSIIVKKHILKSGKKPVATKLYGNDAYMIHFQTYGC